MFWSPTNGCDKLRKLRGRKVIWEGKGGSQARAGQGFALRSQSPDGCRVEGQIILLWQRVRLFELKLAFATGQDETGEANTPSCPQEHGCDKHELSKLPNFSQTNGYYEALDELFLPVSGRNCLGSNIIWLDRKLWSKTGQMATTQLFPVSYASLMKQRDLCQFSVWPEQTVQEGVLFC